MFVCRLSLGHASSTEANKDGDHIWVPTQQYYVISQPQQILPQYIVRFSRGRSVCSPELTRALSLPRWSTKRERQIMHVPANRPCVMSMQSTNALWMGYLHANVPDNQLESDVRAFFARHAPSIARGLRVHIASGKYKKAHVQLPAAMARDLVHELNTLPFVEAGRERRICVDDAHGSPTQKCPRNTAMYCRGRNQRFIDPCWCLHETRPTELASFELQPIELTGAKGDEIITGFMQSGPFHDGTPRVIEINAIENPILAKMHDRYKAYIKDKNKEEPKVMDLYHGTNNMILEDVYTHGLQPPSDTAPAEDCEVSGGKGLSTTLCNNDCPKCTKRHYWDKCHMFGLGIYLADLAQKSHRYCSQPVPSADGRRRCFRMVICSVVLGRTLEVAGHLNKGDSMHDVFSLRGLWKGDLEGMVKPADAVKCHPNLPVEQHDLLYIKGLLGKCRPGFSVHNSEYISFHPYQCLPRYEVVYEI